MRPRPFEITDNRNVSTGHPWTPSPVFGLMLFTLLCITTFRSSSVCRAGEDLIAEPLAWPPITREQKPWTRWWWFGSVVDKKNLEAELTRLAEAGLGGIELTCLYGAKGFEDRYISYLSPRWIEMLNTTSDLAERLDLGIDLPPCSGWIYAGPWVKPTQTITRARLETKSLQQGESWQIELADRRVAAIMAYSRDGKILDLSQDHVKDRWLRWQAPEGKWTVFLLSMEPSPQRPKAVAPGGEGLSIDPLSRQVVTEYLAGFGQRAAGIRSGAVRAYYHDSFEYAIDYSADLLDEFAHRRGYDLRNHLPALFGHADEDPSLRNDSVARVRCDYRETVADMLLENFVDQLTDWAHERGSKSRNQAHGSPGNLLDLYAAADIPETELYGRLDHPGPPMHPFTDVMSVKLASSAGHVAGRQLIAAESFTWLDNHFHTTLDQMKTATDRFLLGGANHIFFHGTAYSPDEVPWPGWMYFASSQVNPRNTIWRDLPVLNQYIARCQSVLQSGQPDNDVMLYWPIYDLWQVGHDVWWQDYLSYFLRRRHELPDLPLLDANWGTTGYMQLPLHSKHLWLDAKPVGRVANRLWKRGYGFDFVSDRLLSTCVAEQGGIQSPGARYQVVIVPAARLMPLETLEKLLRLAGDGATVAFVAHLPEDVPGLHEVEARQAQQRALLANLKWSSTNSNQVHEAVLDRGRVLVGRDVEELLDTAGVRREPFVDHGLQFIRRRHHQGHHYFVVNPAEQAIDEWFEPVVKFKTAALLDPITGAAGLGQTRLVSRNLPQNRLPLEPGRQIRLQLQPGQSVIVRTFDQRVEAPSWRYREPVGDPIEIRGKWTVEFLEGGPELPDPYTTELLGSWTKSADARAERFAGTARYSIMFDAPTQAKSYLLDLGSLGDSARVVLNNQPLATLINRTFQVRVNDLWPSGNHLQIDVTNVAANRIRDLDIRKVPWKELHGYGMLNMGAQVNKAGLKSRKLDASLWPVREAGLFGPVTLQPLE